MLDLTMTLLATAVALAGAMAGIYLTGARQSTRFFVPFSGGLLVGVALFGLLPELAQEIGWLPGAMLFLAGYGVLRLIDRSWYPVCPSCSHDHDHATCTAVLHGFAAPLVAATGVHAFLDGWSIATAQWAGDSDLRLALPLAVALHKVPEGIALGVILRAAVPSRPAALGWCLAAELPTLFGGAIGLALAPRMGAHWLHYPLAVAGGCFFYLGLHAVHGEWRRQSSWRAWVPALAGTGGAAALQLGVRTLIR